MYQNVIGVVATDESVALELHIVSREPLNEAFYDSLGTTLTSMVDKLAKDLRVIAPPTPEQVDALLRHMRRPRPERPS